jgi:3-oxoacid CoA-transferase
MAKAAKCTIAEVEEIVPVGTLDPDQIHLPGVYVHRLIKGEHYEKRIEKLTVSSDGKESENTDSPAAKRREKIVRRAAKEFKVIVIYRNIDMDHTLTSFFIGW